MYKNPKVSFAEKDIIDMQDVDEETEKATEKFLLGIKTRIESWRS